jgi:PAS domain S-box-containing protein
MFHDVLIAMIAASVPILTGVFSLLRYKDATAFKSLIREVSESKLTMTELRKELLSNKDTIVSLRAEMKEQERNCKMHLTNIGARLNQALAQRHQAFKQLEELRYSIGYLKRQGLIARIKVDHNFKIIEWDDKATAMFQYTTDDILGQDASVLVAPEIRNRHVIATKRLIATGGGEPRKDPIEGIAIAKDGERFKTRVLLTGWKNGNWNYEATIEAV